MNKVHAQNELSLPRFASPEALKLLWSKVLRYGDRILVAGHHYNGPGQPSYFGAVYRFQGEDRSCEGTIRLENVSDVYFEDDGHAMAWALTH